MQNTETGIVYELPVNHDPILEVDAPGSLARGRGLCCCVDPSSPYLIIAKQAIEKRLKSVVPGVGLERDGEVSLNFASVKR